MNNKQSEALLDHFSLQNRNALTHVIRAAVSSGIIDALFEKQCSIEQLAEQLDLKPEPLKLFLDVLCETELLEKYGDDYALSTVGRLIPRQLYDFGDIHWSNLGSFLKSGVRLPNDGANSLTDRDFLTTIQSGQWLRTAAALDAGQILDLGKSRKAIKILEIGGAGSVFGVTLIHRDPDSRLVLLDDREGLNIAQTTIKSIQLENRVELVEADYLNFELESRFDMVLMAGILHRHDLETCTKLFANAHKHLKPNGELVVVDVFPGQDTGDLNRKIMALELNLRSGTGMLHDPTRIQHEMILSGFDQVRYAHLPSAPNFWGLIVAERNCIGSA